MVVKDTGCWIPWLDQSAFFRASRNYGRLVNMSSFGRRFLIVLLVISIIVYGSLYPFAFHWPDGGSGPIRSLLTSWPEHQEKTDFLANILLYAPLGFATVHALSARANSVVRISIAIALGAGLSTSIELIQYFDPGRVSSASDIFANTLGTVVGALLATFARIKIASPSADSVSKHKVPLLLLAAWATDRLYPFVPDTDLHKYWTAIKPLFLHPHVESIELFRHVAIWSTVFVLVDEAAEGKHSIKLFLALALILIAGPIVVVGGVVSLPAILGSMCAFLLAVGTARFPRVRLLTVLCFLAAYVIAERLEPFTFGVIEKPFQWIPFHGFLNGSMAVNVLSFLEKSFFYGALIWILARVGVRLGLATLLVSAALFSTSIAQIYLPGRSAEITDAILALAVGMVISLLADQNVRASASSHERQTS